MSALDNIFDITPSEKSYETVDDLKPIIVDESESSPEDSDFNYTRQNQVDLIEVGKAAVQTAMKIANESEQPRAIETLAIMLKTASEMNRQLVQMSKDRAEVKAVKKMDNSPQKIEQQTNNTIVMNGTLKEMVALLKKQKELA
jgi:hypothetical protein